MVCLLLSVYLSAMPRGVGDLFSPQFPVSSIALVWCCVIFCPCCVLICKLNSGLTSRFGNRIGNPKSQCSSLTCSLVTCPWFVMVFLVFSSSSFFVCHTASNVVFYVVICLPLVVFITNALDRPFSTHMSMLSWYLRITISFSCPDIYKLAVVSSSYLTLFTIESLCHYVISLHQSICSWPRFFVGLFFFFVVLVLSSYQGFGTTVVVASDLLRMSTWHLCQRAIAIYL